MLLTNEQIKNLTVVFNKLIEDFVRPIEKSAEVVNFYSELLKKNSDIDEKIQDLQQNIYKDRIVSIENNQINFKDVESKESYLQDIKNIFEDKVEISEFHISLENLKECKLLVPKDLAILAFLMN